MLGSPSVSKQYLGYCSPVSRHTRKAGQKMAESWVPMRGRQNYILKPSFHPLPACYTAMNPFLKSLTCLWPLLGCSVVTLSYFSRNRGKEQRIAGTPETPSLLCFIKKKVLTAEEKSLLIVSAHSGLYCHCRHFAPGIMHRMHSSWDLHQGPFTAARFPLGFPLA